MQVYSYTDFISQNSFKLLGITVTKYTCDYRLALNVEKLIQRNTIFHKLIYKYRLGYIKVKFMIEKFFR